MPLFSLVSTYTTGEGSVVTVSSFTETKDLEGGKLMKEFVTEVAKEKTPSLSQSKGSFRKDAFVVFFINHSEQPLTCLAFTNKNYNSELAFKCLVEYESLVEREVDFSELSAAKKDLGRSLKGTDRLVDTYYSGASMLLNDSQRQRVTDSLQRAEVNLEKTKRLKDDTDKMTYYANKMKEDGEIMTGERPPPKKSGCHLF